MIAGRRPTIRAAGTIEGAMRAYSVIARIAARRQQANLVSMILDEAEGLGERRHWPRLICVGHMGRLKLLLEHEQVDDVEKCTKRLERLASHHRFGESLTETEIRRVSTLARCRIALARGQAKSAIASLRQARDEAAIGADLHRGFQLGIFLVQALAVTGGTEEAIAILRDALKIGATVGLCQAFLDGGPAVRCLLAQLCEQEPFAGDGLDPARPFVRSLLDRRTNRLGAQRENKPGLNSRNPLSEQERKILKHIGATVASS
jgi:hypothetical protein